MRMEVWLGLKAVPPGEALSQTGSFGGQRGPLRTPREACVSVAMQSACIVDQRVRGVPALEAHPSPLETCT